MINEFETLHGGCHELKGKNCWSVVAGSGTGSRVSLGFGAKISRKRPLSNPNLTPEQRAYDAEYKIFIECVWRLDDQLGVVCGAWDDNQSGGPMQSGLALLIDHRVTSVELRRPGLDLRLSFDHGLELALFCDQVNEVDGNDNYSLFLPRFIVGVETRSVIQVEERG